MTSPLGMSWQAIDTLVISPRWHRGALDTEQLRVPAPVCGECCSDVTGSARAFLPELVYHPEARVEFRERAALGRSFGG